MLHGFNMFLKVLQSDRAVEEGQVGGNKSLEGMSLKGTCGPDEMMPAQVSSEVNCLRNRCSRCKGYSLSRDHDHGKTP